MKKQSKQLIYLLLAALWGYLIFYLSSIPNLNSGLPNVYDLVLRKAAHIGVFTMLTYFIIKSLDNYKKSYLVFIIFVVLTYALVDEIHQTTVVSRSGSAKDIVIDSIGIYVGLWLYRDQVFEKIFRQYKKRS